MNVLLRPSASLVCAFALLAGCAGDYAGGSEESASAFDTLQSTIFNTKCTTGPCHSFSAAAGGLVLESGVSYASLVNAASDNPSAQGAGLLRVEPFDTSASFLYIKLVNPTAAQGSRMPQGQAPLSQSELALIRNWIDSGAPGSDPPSAPTATATETTVPTETPTPPPSPTGTLPATATVTATSTPEPATLSEIQETIFNPTCATMFCHDATTLSGNLNLEAGASYAALVGVTADNEAARTDGLLRVTSGDPAKSFLMTKLHLTRFDLRYFSPMPLTGGPLSQDKIDLVSAWILRGAPND